MSQKMKLLIAYDGSECAAAALDDLRWAGLPQEAEAIVLSVSEHWLPPPSAFELAESSWQMGGTDKALDLAKRAAYSLNADFPGWEVRAETASGSPARKLIEKADEWQPDLLVVGSHGLTTLGRFILGSVSQKILSEAHCSVRIARQHATPTETAPRILSAVDGSEHAEAAVQVIAARTWPWGTEIRLIAADDPFDHPAAGYLRWPIGQPSPADEAASKRWMQNVIEGPTQTLRKLGRSVSHAIKWGDARNVILEEAAEWKADMIFMGARGRGRFHRLLLGSVSSAVTARASCTVEVVRTASAQQEERR